MKGRVYDILLFVWAIIFALFINISDKPDWDVVPYMGIVAHSSEQNMSKVQQEVFTALEKHVSEERFYYMTYETCKQCYTAYTDANGFQKQLNNYRGRSLNTFLAIVFYKVGLPLWYAVWLPIILAVIGLLFVIYKWLQAYVDSSYALVITVLFSLLPMFAVLQQSAAPSMMSNFLLVLSLYLLVAKSSKLWLYLALLFSVCVRVDNIVFVTVVLLADNLSIKKFSLLILALIISILIGLLLFAKGIVSPPVSAGLIQKMSDLNLWNNAIIELNKNYTYYWLLAIVLLVLSRSQIRYYVLLVVVAVALHLLLFPYVEYRFFAVFNIAILLLWVAYLKSAFNRVATTAST